MSLFLFKMVSKSLFLSYLVAGSPIYFALNIFSYSYILKYPTYFYPRCYEYNLFVLYYYLCCLLNEIKTNDMKIFLVMVAGPTRLTSYIREYSELSFKGRAPPPASLSDILDIKREERRQELRLVSPYEKIFRENFFWCN